MAITAELAAGASGRSVYVRFRNDGALTNISSFAGLPSITINGSAATISPNAALTATTIPHAIYYLANTIPPGADVRFTDSGGGYSASAPSYVGSWTSVSSAGFRADYKYAASGSGTVKATWTFTVPALGSYRVSATWVEFSNRATNTPFIVYDNTTPFATVRLNQQLAPNDRTDEGVGWEDIGTFNLSTTTLKVEINDDANNFVIADGIRIERTDVVGYKAFGNDTTSGPSPAYATAAGTAPTITNAVVDVSRIGTSNAALAPPAGRTLKVGANFRIVGSWFEPLSFYGNMLKAGGASGSSSTTNADGYPLTVLTGTVLVSAPASPYWPKGWPHAETGTYTLKWDGAGNLTLGSYGGATVTQTSSNITGTTNNERVYSVTRPAGLTDTTWSLTLQVAWDITAGVVSNWRLYPPNVATDGSQLFHPNIVANLSKFDTIRFLDSLKVTESSIVDYSDFSRQAQASYAQSVERFRSVSVTSITDEPSTAFWPNSGWQRFLVTTATAHNLKEGQIVVLTPTSGSITVTLATSGSLDITYTPVTVHVLSPTTLAFVRPAQNVPRTHETITGWSGTGVYLAVDGTAGMPPEDCVELCNQASANYWICVPHAITDAAAATLFAMIATNLDPELNVYVEYSNETWNEALGFFHSFWIAGKGNSLGYPNRIEYYALRSSQLHTIARTAFTNAGRAASQVKRVFGGWWYGESRTDTLATFCAAQSIPMDYIAFAPYEGTGPLAVANYDYDDLTTSQLMDALELNLQALLVTETAMANGHRAHLDEQGLTATEFLCYEGAVAYAGLSGNSSVNAIQSLSCGSHPRMKNAYWEYCSNLQSWGVDLWCMFSFSQPTINEGAGYGSLYALYLGTAMRPGKGDGTDGEFNNTAFISESDPAELPDLLAACSPSGYALNVWNTADAVPSDRAIRRWYNVIFGMGG